MTKRMTTFKPMKNMTLNAITEACEEVIGDPVWDHITEKNNQIGKIVDAKPITNEIIGRGMELTIEITDKSTIDKIKLSELFGLSIGGTSENEKRNNNNRP